MIFRIGFAVGALFAPATLALAQVAGVDPGALAATATDILTPAVTPVASATDATAVATGVLGNAAGAVTTTVQDAASAVPGTSEGAVAGVAAATAPAMWSANNAAGAESMSSSQVASMNVMVQTGSETVMMNSGRFTQPEWQTDQAKTVVEAEPLITQRAMTKAQVREQLAIIRF
ncbi:MAG: hypothetical protein Q8R82_21050 [Hyphomonadaceae bacterium]|nr:hypothetical protein [Hyphomonadaceae bacterium]